MKPLVALAQSVLLPIHPWLKLQATSTSRMEFFKSKPTKTAFWSLLKDFPSVKLIAGIGPVDEAILHNVFNISTVADLYLHRRTLLQVLNNERKITQYLNAALGFPDSPHPLATTTAAAEKKEQSQKSFSREKTVSRPIVNLPEALYVGRTLTEKLVNEILKRHENRPGGSIRTITLKIDESSFVSRSKTANLNGLIPLHFQPIWKVVQQLIEEEFHKESKVRLIGVNVGNRGNLAAISELADCCLDGLRGKHETLK